MKTWHEYYRDKNIIEVLIKYSIKIPSVVKDFNIDDHPFHTRQNGNEIHINYHKDITQTLFDDIKQFFDLHNEGKEVSEELLLKNPSRYIVGFIGETIGRVNNEILIRKYQEGHLILRSISQFDVYNVFIVDKKGNYYPILWPSPIPSFPPAQQNAEVIQVIFIQDLIEAMTEYFHFNINGCIRKVITSLENYFNYYKLKPKRPNIITSLFHNSMGRFYHLVTNNIIEKYYDYTDRDLKILRENIAYVYKIRNLIVHDKLRPNVDNLHFCYKAIMTLLYIYQSNQTKQDGKYDYIFSQHMHFKTIVNMVTGLNLDRLAKAEEKSEKINESNSLYRFQGEFARLFGPSRKGRSFQFTDLDNEMDTDEFHKYHLGLEVKAKEHYRKLRKNKKIGTDAK